MASSAVAKGVKAIYAQPAFSPTTPLNSGRFNLLREIAIGTALGITAGMVWKVRLLHYTAALV